MVFYQKISVLLAFLVGILIFSWSSVPGTLGAGGISYLPVFYHIGIFFLFGAFLFVTFWKNLCLKNILFVILLSAVYAVLDEVHQAFVPGRTAGIFDFGLDAVGIIGSLVFIGFCRIFKK